MRAHEFQTFVCIVDSLRIIRLHLARQVGEIDKTLSDPLMVAKLAEKGKAFFKIDDGLPAIQPIISPAQMAQGLPQVVRVVLNAPETYTFFQPGTTLRAITI